VSRTILYGLGAVLLAGLGWALSRRAQEDEAERAHAQRLQLQNLSLLLLQDPAGTTTLSALEGPYAEEALPRSLHALRHRMRALALRSAERHEESLVASAQAVALAPDATERVAAEIEWAHTLQMAGRPGEARERLAALPAPPPGGATLALLIGLADAGAREALGEGAEAVEDLRELLVALPAPLPDGPEIEIEGHAWTPGEAAFLLVRFVAKAARATSDGPAAGAEAVAPLWRRLLDLRPGDVRIAVEAAGGLLRAGDREAAARALDGARRRDRTLTATYLRALAVDDDGRALADFAADLPHPLKSATSPAR
jgi:tetratricopeptide (TPR) repeat protein